MSSPLCIKQGAQAGPGLQSSAVWPGQASTTVACCSVTFPTCVYGHCGSLRGKTTHLNPLLVDLYERGKENPHVAHHNFYEYFEIVLLKDSRKAEMSCP